MKKEMENMISKDLGIEINQIRHNSWRDLDKIPRKIFESPFRPQNAFIVGGNINLSQKREMGLWGLKIRGKLRRVEYGVKCLLKNKRIK